MKRRINFYQGNPLQNELRECRRIINKLLGGEKLTRKEFNFCGMLPGPISLRRKP